MLPLLPGLFELSAVEFHKIMTYCKFDRTLGSLTASQQDQFLENFPEAEETSSLSEEPCIWR